MRHAITAGAASAAGLLLFTSVAAGQTSPAASAQPVEPMSAFAVRADPSLATKVNAVLAKLAREVEAALPKGTTADAFVSRLCGGRRPVRVETVTPEDGSAPRVRFSPCVFIRKNVKVEVDKNNTLEGFAVRNGLSPEAVKAMTIEPGPNSSPGRVPTPTTMLPKDRVVIPEVPVWTSILIKPEVRDRSVLVSALADAIGCAAEEADTCLSKKGVAVLERGVVEAPRQPAQPERKPEPPQAMRERSEVRGGGGATAFPVRPLPPPPAAPSAAAAVPMAAPVAAAAPLAAAAGVAPPFVDAIPVAPDQWPYDAKLLAAILKNATGFRPDPVVIGIAEGGLAGANGAPLPTDMFASSEDIPEPDQTDDDDNGYLNDLLGAGQYRRVETMSSPYKGTGDIGLCLTGPPTFSSWGPKSIELASHGSIVATIAAGRPVRVADPTLVQKLPRITFYRMLDNVCADDASFTGTVERGDIELAFDYLDQRAQIINISYSVRPEEAKFLINTMKQNLTTSNKLLVLPAGNGSAGNLDQTRDFCPACLGNPTHDSTMVKRTVVVGAASRELRRQSFSNSGPTTIWIYAPGEPNDALDVRGQDATPLGAATSYAAPYASLAAALMWSRGIDDVKRVKERLDVATWPLFQDDGRSDPMQGGVLDLVKAAAVREWAIDVKERGTDGTFTRRTYVGSLVGELSNQDLCAGKRFLKAKTQSLRFETSPFNDRQVRVYPRNSVDDTQHKWKAPEACRAPDGSPTIRLKTLDGTEKTFSVSDVMQIQMPWSTGS
jgi:hypothetical protein